MAVCSTPTQDQGTHHPSMEGVGTWESSVLAEELLIVNGCYRVESQFSLGWAWFVDHAFLGSLILTCMYGSTNKIHCEIQNNFNKEMKLEGRCKRYLREIGAKGRSEYDLNTLHRL